MSNVKISNVTKVFAKNATPAIDDFSLEIEQGELVVLLGPSGCGKTTLLRSIAGLERPDSGRIAFGDAIVFDPSATREVPTHKRDVGMVFQNYALWPHMTVAQNVAYPMKARGIGSAAIKSRVSEVLRLVECEPLAGRYPAALSGGQQQRVALARAMSANPAVLLFDEPLSNLDFRLRAQLRQDIRDLHQVARFTGVYVTHDQTEALQIGDRVAVMDAGRLVQVGSPVEVFTAPASPYVAKFLGINNRLAVTRTADGRWRVDDTGVEPLSMPANEPGSYELFVRSSDVILAPPGAASTSDQHVTVGTARLRDVVYSGEVSEWLLDFDDTHWTASAPADAWPFMPGDAVAVAFRAGAELLYPRPV